MMIGGVVGGLLTVSAEGVASVEFELDVAAARSWLPAADEGVALVEFEVDEAGTAGVAATLKLLSEGVTEVTRSISAAKLAAAS